VIPNWLVISGKKENILCRLGWMAKLFSTPHTARTLPKHTKFRSVRNEDRGLDAPVTPSAKVRMFVNAKPGLLSRTRDAWLNWLRDAIRRKMEVQMTRVAPNACQNRE